MKQFKIIKKTYLRLLITIIIMIGGVLLFAINARYSIEFTGGMTLRLAQTVQVSPVIQDINQALLAQDIANPEVYVQNNTADSIITVKLNLQDDKQIETVTQAIADTLVQKQHIQDRGQIIEQAIVGPSVGDYMQKAAVRALVIGIILMVIYMLFSFAAIRKHISPTILATVTIITMLFDVIVPAGAYGILMMINPTIQIDTIFIIAILTTIGYSINDTIIIFDRIRENMQNIKEDQKKSLIIGKVFEDSLWQTMRRSMGTSLSTLLVIIAMYIFGTGVIKQFAFTMGMGVISGTYSSIFVAAPLAYLLLGRFKKEQNKL